MSDEDDLELGFDLDPDARYRSWRDADAGERFEPFEDFPGGWDSDDGEEVGS